MDTSFKCRIQIGCWDFYAWDDEGSSLPRRIIGDTIHIERWEWWTFHGARIVLLFWNRDSLVVKMSGTIRSYRCDWRYRRNRNLDCNRHRNKIYWEILERNSIRHSVHRLWWIVWFCLTGRVLRKSACEVDQWRWFWFGTQVRGPEIVVVPGYYRDLREHRRAVEVPWRDRFE